MALQVSNVEIPVAEGSSSEVLVAYASEKLGVARDSVKSVQIKKKSLDARRKNRIKHVFQLQIELETIIGLYLLLLPYLLRLIGLARVP